MVYLSIRFFKTLSSVHPSCNTGLTRWLVIVRETNELFLEAVQRRRCAYFACGAEPLAGRLSRGPGESSRRLDGMAPSQGSSKTYVTPFLKGIVIFSSWLVPYFQSRDSNLDVRRRDDGTIPTFPRLWGDYIRQSSKLYVLIAVVTFITPHARKQAPPWTNHHHDSSPTPTHCRFLVTFCRPAL